MNIRFLYALGISVLATGCVTTTFAPGAADVTIARNAADVAACTAMGNIGPGLYNEDSVRNLTIGLGGNTFFVTSENHTATIGSGIAYRCPNR
jgi:hypothetical protein